MTDMIVHLFNLFSCGALAVMLLWAILSHKIRDGIIIKSGLIVMMLGFGAVAVRSGAWIFTAQEAFDRLDRAVLLIVVGIGLTMFGYSWRAHKAHHPLVRKSDWVDLEGEKNV